MSPFTSELNGRARDEPVSILLMCQLQSIILPFSGYFGRSSGIEQYNSFMPKVLKYQRESKDDPLKGSSDKNPSRGVSSCLFIRLRLFLGWPKTSPAL